MELTPSVTRSVLLDLDLDDTWDILVDPEVLAEWLGHGRLPTEPGSRTRLVEHDGTVRTIEALEVDPGRTLRWRWCTDDQPEAVSEVEITVATDVGGGTRLTVVERATSGARCSLVPPIEGTRWDERLLGLELRALRTLSPLATV
jgi:uncharacterized protein YndB with AHSA1/START domain